MPTTSPGLSLIIGSRNEGDYLRRTVEGALALTPPEGGLECSLYDDASSDGSTDFCDEPHWRQRRDQGTVRLQRGAFRIGVSRGRRQGAAGCRAEVLVFLDAHLEFPQSDLWLKVQDHFRNPGCDLLGIDCFDSRNGASTAGSIYSSKRLCHLNPAWVRLQSDPLVDVTAPFVNGGFFAIRRQVYERLEGFPDFLEDWGHEDRFLSMLAGLCGYHCRVDQRLRVGHLYKDVFNEQEGLTQPEAFSDPLPSDGVVLPEVVFRHADAATRGVSTMLMNSLRCGAVLYSAEVAERMHEQLRFDFGAKMVETALQLLLQEKPQLKTLMLRLGLGPEQRDRQMVDFFQRFRPVLPMLDEAELHATAHLQDAQLALDRVRQLPLALSSLHQPDADHYRTARLYREALYGFQLQRHEEATRLLAELLTIDPDYLPAICLLAVNLRAVGRQAGERFWLQRGADIIERHRQVGPGPIGAFHPASLNPYLRHLYWPEADRMIWAALADLEERAGHPSAAVGWLLKLLDQSPEESAVREQLLRLIQPAG
ncbi:glycosyltransferase [Synechococcus sp. FACHB-909]|uniref:glycosyltransferase n=1 Tax=Synechococcus sp. FACHB-909 TaxID=2692863 RepID=UPI00168605AD|nr:glycosyltransferase [Synechococcus sp. FACHB-909]MBD2718039.1 glycosyltransferase [Synechococcus sp. FACHB-909]